MDTRFVGGRLRSLFEEIKTSGSLRRHASNAIYGVADYLAQPIGMLVAAPFLVRALGIQQYGVWMLVAAVLGSMGMLSIGFGDATIKYVSAYRGLRDSAGVQRIVGAAMTINGILGGILAIAVWCLAPFAAFHVFKIEPQYHQATTDALRVASATMFVRSVESVLSSTLRAFEQYGPTVKINVFMRSLNVVSAVVLAGLHYGVVSILSATLAISLLSVFLQFLAVRRHIGPLNFLPGFHRAALKEMAGFGCYSWLQALGAVTFMHADRLLVAAMLGTAEVAYYSICLQATQPIHGLLSSALNFLFPNLSARYVTADVDGTRRMYSRAIWTSLLLVLALCLPLAFFSRPILAAWMGPVVAQHAYATLSILAVAYGILALNVVPHYSLLAAGQVRYVSLVNVLGGALSLVVAAVLIPSTGLLGPAIGRLVYGPAVSLNFIKAREQFFTRRELPVYQ